jgi:hypothetical protein
MIRFLRLRNREGFDVYLRPYAAEQNAGYILVDLDTAAPSTLERMSAHGHEPCVVTETSAGHLQAWVRISETPLEPTLATAIGQRLAHAYHGDPASTDWRHLGRLAGFTNQKPTARRPDGYAPWVRLLYAHSQLASQGASLIDAARRGLSPSSAPLIFPPMTTPITPVAAAAIYQRLLNRLSIPQRFPQPDWSIADLWIAKELFHCRIPAEQVQAILRLGSPGFPRRHGKPEDYLARTLRRAARDLEQAGFPARPRARCVKVCQHA